MRRYGIYNSSSKFGYFRPSSWKGSRRVLFDFFQRFDVASAVATSTTAIRRTITSTTNNNSTKCQWKGSPSWTTHSKSSFPFLGRKRQLSSTTTTAQSSGIPQDNLNDDHDQNHHQGSGDDGTTTTTTTDLDVLIVGGGVVGCSFARQLLRQTPNLKIGLVEARAGPTTTDPSSSLSPLPPPHPRSYALSPQSLEWLGLVGGVGPSYQAATAATENPNGKHNEITDEKRLGYYTSMQVWEAGQPASILFRARQDLASDYLGAMVEEDVLVQHLWKEINEISSTSTTNGGCRLWTNQTVASLELPASSSAGVVQVQLQPSSLASTQCFQKTKNKISEEEGAGDTNQQRPVERIRAQLVIGADGANSWIRTLAGIARSVLDYEQQALTFTVKLQSPHQQRAFQRFLGGGPNNHNTSNGPIALLPTFWPDHAIVVWSTSPKVAQRWKDMTAAAAAASPQDSAAATAELIQELNAMLQPGPERLASLLPSSFMQNGPPPMVNLLYGAEKLYESLFHYGPTMMAQQQQQESKNGTFMAPPMIESIVSPRYAFSLTCAQVSTYIGPRLALVGDAAHSVHPMAGQGLNLGLQDAAQLLRVIQKSYQAGMDLALFLSEYDRNRQVSVSATLGGIHALHRLFQPPPPPKSRLLGQFMLKTPLQHVKSMGMNLIQNVPLLRKQLAQAACHGVLGPLAPSSSSSSRFS
ncbi:hypothetical protein ACA910_002045 [Epithemia clementina (nom. ined.)]